MFDDQLSTPPPKGNVPDNLPLGEPEDIFASSAAPLPTSNNQVNEEVADIPPAPLSAPTALRAGVLRPVAAEASLSRERPTVASRPPLPREPISSPSVSMPNDDIMNELRENQTTAMPYKIQEPSFGRNVLIGFGIILLFAMLGAGGWWAYRAFVQPEADTREVPITVPTSSEEDTIADDTLPGDDEPDDAITVDESVLFGDVLDSDEDGLDDFRETDIGTNKENPDTDGDGLRDFEEVSVWKTDPLETDSDADSYSDGEEVKNGYNPSGPGRIFQLPTSTVPNNAVSAESYRSAFLAAGKQSSVGGYTRVTGADDCNTSFSCFIARARTCQKAGIEYISLVDLQDALGVTEKTRTYAEIRGASGASLCQVYFLTQEVTLTFASSVPGEVKSEQLTRADIRAGQDGVCTFETAAFVDLLEAWSAGEFNENDFASETCTGNMFEA